MSWKYIIYSVKTQCINYGQCILISLQHHSFSQRYYTHKLNEFTRDNGIVYCSITSNTSHYEGSHTSQMRKFKGISSVIKGSNAHFQRYFWKTVVTLLYVNKISSNFSYLFQDCLGLCNIIRRYQ